MALATLKIDFDAGESIENAYTEAIRISKLLNIFVKFPFNGVRCIVGPNADYHHCVNAYREAIKSNDEIKFVVSQ